MKIKNSIYLNNNTPKKWIKKQPLLDKENIQRSPVGTSKIGLSEGKSRNHLSTNKSRLTLQLN